MSTDSLLLLVQQAERQWFREGPVRGEGGAVRSGSGRLDKIPHYSRNLKERHLFLSPPLPPWLPRASGGHDSEKKNWLQRCQSSFFLQKTIKKAILSLSPLNNKQFWDFFFSPKQKKITVIMRLCHFKTRHFKTLKPLLKPPFWSNESFVSL